LARKSTIKKKEKNKNKEKTSVKYIALPATLPSGLNYDSSLFQNLVTLNKILRLKLIDRLRATNTLNAP